MADLLQRLPVDRCVIPQQLDLLQDRVLLARLDAATLEKHSFLDQRILRQGMDFEWLDWARFDAAARTLPAAKPAYLFHIGHCGSTLLSRLVAEATGTAALREPLPLRTFALDRAEGNGAFLTDQAMSQRMQSLDRVWARGAGHTVVKATSICTNLIDRVDADAPVAFVYQPAATHLAVVLANDNVQQDLRGFGQMRYRRLVQMGIEVDPLAALSVGEAAALSWLVEMLGAGTAMQGNPRSCVDFDVFLESPAPMLAELCSALALEAETDACEQAVAGPTMQMYSKAPEHAYGPQLRRDVIEDSRRRNAREIARGLEWLDRLASEQVQVRVILDTVMAGA